MSVGGSSKTLVNGTDYTVSYKNNTNRGTATITITGKGNFTGTKSVTFKINGCLNVSNQYSIVKTGNVTVYSCLTDYLFVSMYTNNKTQTSAIQGLAVSDNYYYISGLPRNSYKISNVEQTDIILQRLSNANIRRINKSDLDDDKLSLLKYNGHLQYLDVIKDNNIDKIMIEQGPYFRSVSNNTLYRSGHRGIAITPFAVANNYNNAIIPAKSYYLKTDSTLDIVNSSNYSSADSYYEKILSNGLNDNYYKYYSFAADEKNNAMIIIRSKTAYVYKLQDYLNGKLVAHPTYKSSFKISDYTVSGTTLGWQGIDIGGGYLYMVYGSATEFSDETSNIVIRRFDLKTGTELSVIKLNLESYLSTKDGFKCEAEGISYYNGDIYIGVQNFKKSESGYFIDILKIKVNSN